MTIEEAIEILDLHQQWRKGAEIPMQDVVKLGMAIDLILGEVRHKEKDACDFTEWCADKYYWHGNGIWEERYGERFSTRALYAIRSDKLKKQNNGT